VVRDRVAGNGVKSSYSIENKPVNACITCHEVSLDNPIYGTIILPPNLNRFINPMEA
jgi:hypothetical protein